MAHAVAEVDVNASADTLYAFLADFGSVSWMQGVTKVEVEGDGPGMARSIYAGGEECVVEVLESLEPAERRVGYTITQNNPLPVADYHAHCTAIEVGANSSRLRWACDFTPADGVDESLAVAQVEAMYGVLAGWVKNAIEEPS
ncbi:MAG: SRPBCC family protein [Myxococcota bacterium]|nr:SRPBCC family protein [Myxococcota bacterium]